jgi:hypothetical protein
MIGLDHLGSLDRPREEVDMRVIPPGRARSVRLSWPADAEAALLRRELADPLLSGVWGDAITRIDLTVGERTRIAVTAELDTLKDI